MARGDHIYVRRVGYRHHGIDCGDGTVIHYSGEVGQKENAAIVRASYERFAKGGRIRIRRYGICDPPDVVVKRAESRLGERGYNLLFNNCEHFAVWCKTGGARSEQVENRTWGAVGAIGTGVALVGKRAAVSSLGAVPGLSGSGVMSGLATLGRSLGGGAVAGVTVVGIGPAAIATGVMSRVLRDDPALPADEREARAVGRAASVLGGVAGSAATAGIVGATGTVSGLSGAGIASGLAALGGTVGGGMAAGVVVAGALPAVATVVAGYGFYRLCRWLFEEGKPEGGK